MYTDDDIVEANHRIALYNSEVDHFETKLDGLLLVLLNEEEENSGRTHAIYKRRETEGTHKVLVQRHLLDNETLFHQYFRVTRQLFHYVLPKIEADLGTESTTWVPQPINAHQKLCITLRYLATGESFRSLAFQYRVHHSAVSRFVKQCLEAIVKALLKEAIPEPTTDSLKQTIRDYYSKWQFQNCCGAIDGKHVRVKCPPNSGSAFYNYKEYFSIVLLAIVDANIKFIAIDVGSYGREGDAGIYLKSEMGKRINNGLFNIPEPAALPYTDIKLPNIILGDEAFALSKNMMKPFSRQQSFYDRTKTVYNYRLSRARRTTENAFGVMCSYFRIFHTPIATHPDRIDNIILASCILHNLMRSEKIPAPLETAFGATIEVQLPKHNLSSFVPTTGRPNTEGAFIRDKFKDYFNGIGAVQWQNNMI